MMAAKIRPKILIIRKKCGTRKRQLSHISYRKFRINLKLFFLPTNTTSTTQPMNQGVIRSLKAKYRKKMGQKIIRSLEKNNLLPEVLILKPLQMLVSSWNPVSTETIVNCFRKAEISLQIKKQQLPSKMIHTRICRMRLMLYEIFKQILQQKMSTQLH